MTIDELADEAGVPTSTVQFYEKRGLLPSPRREDGTGYYSTEHRERLRLIAHLDERGFSPVAIKQTLDRWTEDRSIAHLLGVGQTAPGFARTPVRMSPEEFAERFAGVDITQEDIQRAVRVGLVDFDGTEISMSNEAFLDLGGGGGADGDSRVGDPRRARGSDRCRRRHSRAIPRRLPPALLGTVRQPGYARR